MVYIQRLGNWLEIASKPLDLFGSALLEYFSTLDYSAVTLSSLSSVRQVIRGSIGSPPELSEMVI